MSKAVRVFGLQECIDDRILDLCIDLDLDPVRVKSVYVARLNNLVMANSYRKPELVEARYQKFMALAWKGTKIFYEDKYKFKIDEGIIDAY